MQITCPSYLIFWLTWKKEKEVCVVFNDQCSAIAIFWKTINIRNVQLYIMVVLTELYRSYIFQWPSLYFKVTAALNSFISWKINILVNSFPVKFKLSMVHNHIHKSMSNMFHLTVALFLGHCIIKQCFECELSEHLLSLFSLQLTVINLSLKYYEPTNVDHTWCTRLSPWQLWPI